MCTALAVIGGRYVSTKISVKHGVLPAHLISLLLLTVSHSDPGRRDIISGVWNYLPLRSIRNRYGPHYTRTRLTKNIMFVYITVYDLHLIL
jgi:hypothetical protein